LTRMRAQHVSALINSMQLQQHFGCDAAARLDVRHFNLLTGPVGGSPPPAWCVVLRAHQSNVLWQVAVQASPIAQMSDHGFVLIGYHSSGYECLAGTACFSCLRPDSCLVCEAEGVFVACTAGRLGITVAPSSCMLHDATSASMVLPLMFEWAGDGFSLVLRLCVWRLASSQGMAVNMHGWACC
jgi:hypothetical protein